MKIKVYWDYQRSVFGAIREFDDDASKCYQEPSTGYEIISCETVELLKPGDVSALFNRQDGDGDDGGTCGSSIMLICLEDDRVIFSARDFEPSSQFPSFFDYEAHCQKELLHMVEEESMEEIEEAPVEDGKSGMSEGERRVREEDLLSEHEDWRWAY